MKERPILFSAPMVRAILSGQKTQTRRFLGPQPPPGKALRCPYGRPRDRLWVRETWQTQAEFDRIRPSELPERARYYIQYPATYDHWVSRKRASIHMPRWASRITLEILSVHQERVQDIDESDALAEGVASYFHGGYDFPASAMPPAVANFRRLWNSIHRANGKGWEFNPWVWVVEFGIAECKEVNRL